MTTPHSARPGEPASVYASGPETGQAGIGPDFARATWPAFMAAGLGAVIVGVVLLAWPKATLTIVAVLIGIGLIVAGLLRLIDGFTAHDASGGRRVAYVLVGLLAVVAGLYCVRHYNLVTGVLAVIVGLFWVIHGIADISIGLFAGPFPGRGVTVLTGVLSLFAGLIVLFWPAITVIVLVRVIGIWLIIYGLLMSITAFSLRRSAASASDPSHLASA
ncbi:MAG TPA: HdeD family acid-resistance protein [Streptosporangiaceae bacterium]|nr:HdeD family acid-resistance protein [Streptosporangiaceae bacterium]